MEALPPLHHVPFLDAFATKHLMVHLAVAFAHHGHDSIGQERKYVGGPYWRHVERVADTLAKLGFPMPAVAAAVLHDVDEDVGKRNPDYGIAVIHRIFGSEIADLVHEVTDVYTPEEYPALNRRARHRREGERMRELSPLAAAIKLADIVDNTHDLGVMDESFRHVYIEEKQYALTNIAMVIGDEDVPSRTPHGYHKELMALMYRAVTNLNWEPTPLPVGSLPRV